MIDVTTGFTRIATGRDEGAALAPKGARITLEFQSTKPLPPDHLVRVRYQFCGVMREGAGIAQATRTVARWGCAVVYHYRFSHWIDALASVGQPIRLPDVESADRIRA
jgi:hypothetical protein